MAVVHAHAEDTLPFGIAQGTKLRPVIHSGSFIGIEVPVGDTNLLCGGSGFSDSGIS